MAVCARELIKVRSLRRKRQRRLEKQEEEVDGGGERQGLNRSKKIDFYMTTFDISIHKATRSKFNKYGVQVKRKREKKKKKSVAVQ